tara:strand:+ start:344 stop:544 length:201 start_codon:yes stop_codon:yes gene_type:complete
MYKTIKKKSSLFNLKVSLLFIAKYKNELKKRMPAMAVIWGIQKMEIIKNRISFSMIDFFFIARIIY